MRRPEHETNGHLPPDRVAACEAGEGTLPERAHLRWCAPCREEVAAVARVRRLTQGLHAAAPRGAAGGDGQPPLTTWEALAPRLRAEGLLREGREARETASAAVVEAPRHQHPRHQHPRHQHPRQWWTRVGTIAAAAGLAAAAGVAAWRQLAGAAATADPRRMVAASAAEGTVIPWDGDPARFAPPALVEAPPEDAPPSLQQQTLQRTRARLAALDQLLAASQAALQAAPDDPVLQQSVERAHAAREAAFRQLGGTLPVSQQLVRY